jgi:hypothetical protein
MSASFTIIVSLYQIISGIDRPKGGLRKSAILAEMTGDFQEERGAFFYPIF